MPITATGIGSGLDVESLVSQLILADVQPAENRLNTKEASYQAQLTAYGSVKSVLSQFQAAAASAGAASSILESSQVHHCLIRLRLQQIRALMLETMIVDVAHLPRHNRLLRALFPRQPRP